MVVPPYAKLSTLPYRIHPEAFSLHPLSSSTLNLHDSSFCFPLIIFATLLLCPFRVPPILSCWDDVCISAWLFLLDSLCRSCVFHCELLEERALTCVCVSSTSWAQGVPAGGAFWVKRCTDLYQGHETPSKVFGDCNSSGGIWFLSGSDSLSSIKYEFGTT